MAQSKIFAMIEVDSNGILEQMKVIEKKADELKEEVSKMQDRARNIRIIEKQGITDDPLQGETKVLNESH